MSDNIELITKPCVGCGFCCIQAKCAAGARLYPSSKICNALIWSEVENRYICNLTRLPGILGEEYRKELYIGAGCCSGLNTWRQDVKNRTKNINNDTTIFTLDPIFQLFLKAFASEPFLGNDKIYLIVSSFEAELQKRNIKNKNEIINYVFDFIKNNKSRMFDSFI